ncbi:hypothetical protein [Microbispora bryophytorum]|uniref:hypothetical protein n=1 Tax=Microbispora bryophytorum TaxID=1460882 RepID=UPI0033D08A13
MFIVAVRAVAGASGAPSRPRSVDARDLPVQQFVTDLPAGAKTRPEPQTRTDFNACPEGYSGTGDDARLNRHVIQPPALL